MEKEGLGGLNNGSEGRNYRRVLQEADFEVGSPLNGMNTGEPSYAGLSELAKVLSSPPRRGKFSRARGID